MSSSLAAPVTTTTTTTTASVALTTASTIPSQPSHISHLGASRNASAVANAATTHPLLPHPIPSQFREIHKNTWLKRLTADGKKVTVGAKKSERSWVVFCVHDDTIALLEGYAEPRQTGAHMPEWIISLQDTLHISHGLIPNSHEFEFVVTLSNEVIRFHAMSWDIMQEWVSTLRSKLREMKIISPRENLYTKLPEVRPPLLPTRDPTSPLPAPPPVPAAIVPGVERVVPQSTANQQIETHSRTNTSANSTTSSVTNGTISATTSTSTLQNPAESTNVPSTSSSTAANAFSASTPNITSMSNTLTQNLLNMLSDPISAYSEQINDSIGSTNDLDSGSDDLNFSDDEFLSPVLRKSCAQLLQGSDSGIRLDVAFGQQRASADHVKNLESLLQCERLIPRPQTSRSQSVGAVDKSKNRKHDLKRTSHSNDFATDNADQSITSHPNNNITELEICNATENLCLRDTNTSNTESIASTADTESNITIIQVSTNESISNNSVDESNPPQLMPKKQLQADIFKFPDGVAIAAATSTGIIGAAKQHEYKSNVQIIPSNSTNTNNSSNSTIQVLTQDLFTNSTKTTTVAAATSVSSTNTNQYSNASRKSNIAANVSKTNTTIFATNNQKVTTVHVAGNETVPISTSVSVYGTCYTPALSSSTTTHNEQSQASTPKLPKKIILTTNSDGITNITVNNNDNRSAGSSISDKVSLHANSNNYDKVFLASNVPIPAIDTHNTTAPPIQPMSPKLSIQRQAQHRQTAAAAPINSHSSAAIDSIDIAPPASPRQSTNAKLIKAPRSPLLPAKTSKHSNNTNSPSHSVSPAMQRRRLVSPPANTSTPSKQQTPTGARNTPFPRNHFLTRGLTEAAIITRPSRKDLYNMKLANAALKCSTTKTTSTVALSNNNEEFVQRAGSNLHHHAQQQQPLIHPLLNRTNSELIEQRRRSSSTSDAQAQRVKVPHSGANNNEQHTRGANNALRIQQPPMPFRNVENGVGGAITAPNSLNNSPSAVGGKRMTLREQQVMQLRREIMHPGGVRLQLRRKDCIGSIAWVDAFGAVWVAGWKQKEHPVLYNALHIGDQLISIAGITISTAAEANKIIRNANTLFVEVLVRRIPFGRGHAIRREREGQCLGLIRDGNTATIVDVVPNSLAARHGLPPKAQSCDGSTLTFWVLTEINGRPLNLFFKENEIRDRLNSVGRDISILVQPSDLITKLKKQLKSLRGYKDYLVQ